MANPHVTIARQVEDALGRFELTRNTFCGDRAVKFFDVSTAGTGGEGSVWLYPSPAMGGRPSFWMVKDLMELLSQAHPGERDALIKDLQN